MILSHWKCGDLYVPPAAPTWQPTVKSILVAAAITENGLPVPLLIFVVAGKREKWRVGFLSPSLCH